MSENASEYTPTPIRRMNAFFGDESTNYYANTAPECKNCFNIREMLQHQQHINAEILAGQKKQKETIDLLSANLQAQIKALAEMQAEHKIELQMLNKKNKEVCELATHFPLTDEESLAELESKICEANITKYIAAVKQLLGGDSKKNLENLLARQLCVDYNADGKCGKKGLKAYKNVFDVIICAIASYSSSPEDEFKAALQVVKKREIRNNFRIKNKN